MRPKGETSLPYWCVFVSWETTSNLMRERNVYGVLCFGGYEGEWNGMRPEGVTSLPYWCVCLMGDDPYLIWVFVIYVGGLVVVGWC